MQQYIRVKEISEKLGVSTSTIWRWVAEGKLPKPFKPTKRTTLWPADAVQEFVDKMQRDQHVSPNDKQCLTNHRVTKA